MLSLAKPLRYYQVFLSHGVGMGIGVGFVFTPTLSNISHIFYEKKSRALATGVALSGTSVGALIFPIRESTIGMI
jgi:MCP family monocarboxylic acid transporter-like MFS transporter 10